VRDFRGSLPSGINKGILVTTGAFTRAAKEEAMDYGKNITIDLIDGEDLINLLLEHEIGVTKEIRTVYTIRKSFFEEV
jgi:restriction system protein